MTLEPSTYIKQFISGYDLIHLIFDGVKTQKTYSNTDKLNLFMDLGLIQRGYQHYLLYRVNVYYLSTTVMEKKTAVDWITTSASNQ